MRPEHLAGVRERAEAFADAMPLTDDAINEIAAILRPAVETVAARGCSGGLDRPSEVSSQRPTRSHDHP